MNNKKKQTAVVAMATVLSVTSIASPIAVMAQENAPAPPAIMQEEMGQQKTAPDIVLPENLQATAGTALEEIPLPEHWTWTESSTVITAETAEYSARFSVDDVTYDYSNVEGYNPKGHYVERMVTVTVEPAKPEPAEPVQGKSNRSLGDAPTAVNAGDIEINETNFPNKEFRDYITSNFDIAPADGKLTSAEIDNVSRINVRDNTQITNLTGIEHFTALTYLDCSNTGISDLDVSKNTKLTELQCFSNGKLAKLTVAGATELTTLYCDNTGITSLDVSKNTKLTRLDCYYNAKLANLTVAGATELTILDCDNTGITSLDVSKNTKLTTLYCYNNAKLAKLTVAGATELTRLDCYNTGITRLDVSKNTKLTRLDCSNNALAYLNIGANNNLIIDKSNLKPVSLEITEDSFNMADKFIGIELGNVTNVSGADYKNGIMSNYDVGTPITYTYACGTRQTMDVTLNLTGSFITITDDMNKTYDGIAVNASPTVKKSGSTGAVSYKWEHKKNDANWETIVSAPTDAGTYRVTATVASDNNSPEATSKPVEFTISQATNGWTENLAIKGWTYGEKANPPTAKASFGDVVFAYSNSKDGTYTDKVPTTAGTWYVKATVTGTDNYTALETVLAFTIAPKSADNNSQITIPSINSDKDVENLVIKDGDKLLVQGTDYDVAKTQDGNKVTVTITFKGNYTGTVTRSYTVEEKTPAGGDKDNNKSDGTKTDNQNTDDKKSVQTGDTTSLGLWSSLLAFSAGIAVFLKRKKQRKETEE